MNPYEKIPVIPVKPFESQAEFEEFLKRLDKHEAERNAIETERILDKFAKK